MKKQVTPMSENKNAADDIYVRETVTKQVTRKLIGKEKPKAVLTSVRELIIKHISSIKDVEKGFIIERDPQDLNGILVKVTTASIRPMEIEFTVENK